VQWDFWYPFNCKFTKASSSEKNFSDRLRIDRIMVMSLWPRFFGPPCSIFGARMIALSLVLVSLSVSLFIRLSTRISEKSKLHPIFYACCLWLCSCDVSEIGFVYFRFLCDVILLCHKTWVRNVAIILSVSLCISLLVHLNCTWEWSLMSIIALFSCKLYFIFCLLISSCLFTASSQMKFRQNFWNHNLLFDLCRKVKVGF